MTETVKHTPGEWKYGVRKDGSIWLSLGNPDTGPHYQGNLVASEEDARLIAAAPEMLEALESALSVHGDQYSWGPVARTAVAKARGGAANA